MMCRIPRRWIPVLLLTFSSVLAGAAGARFAHALSPDVVVSQVYGGGGNSGSTYTHDFIELHNRGAAAVDLTGWSVQYAAAAGTLWQVTVLSGAIAPGGYYLIQEAQGAGGSLGLPTPDATGTIPMSATSAKVALVNQAGALSGACPSSASIIDLVGYGATASCFETAPTPTLGNTTAALRANGGCTETDDNGADFTEAAPNPRNSASSAFSCQVTLAVVIDPPAGGSVAVDPDQASYLIGSTVELTATKSIGYHFLGWSDGATGTTSPVLVTLNANTTVNAHFALLPGAGDIVVSQLYGGGGNSGATYRRDFIELYNRGVDAVDVTGWTVQYSPSDGSTWTTTTLLGTIPRGGYYLVAEAQGDEGTEDLPTPDIVHDIPMHAVNGKVAVVRNNIPLSGECPTDPEISDMVGYGVANCSEGAAAATLDNVTAAHRNDLGCRDTDQNAPDFTAGAPTPRNSATPIHLCTFWLGVGETATAEFALKPVFPNPARDGFRVSFVLARAADIRLEVVDLQGRAVASVAQGVYPAGTHEARWTGASRSGIARSGIYFLRLQVSGTTLTRRVALIR